MINKIPEFIITRTFNAPRDLVWKAWTDPKMLIKWLGPKGSGVSLIKQEFQSGGVLHTKMQSEGGPVIYGKYTYQEITPPSRLTWLQSFSDAEGVNLTRHPFASTWPLELLTTVIFEEHGNKTKVTLNWVPLNANDIELKTFEDALPGMNQGWGGSFEQLDTFLLSL